ncbi:MAG: hypothetical protein CMJ84_17910 [Planctomycetes bacterium]|nr:hypothetical protein [Planctomycetota bacterium]
MLYTAVGDEAHAVRWSYTSEAECIPVPSGALVYELEMGLMVCSSAECAPILGSMPRSPSVTPDSATAGGCDGHYTGISRVTFTGTCWSASVKQPDGCWKTLCGKDNEGACKATLKGETNLTAHWSCGAETPGFLEACRNAQGDLFVTIVGSTGGC